MSSFKEKMTYWGLPLLVVVLFLSAIQMMIENKPIEEKISIENQDSNMEQEGEFPRNPTLNEDLASDQNIFSQAIKNEEVSQCAKIQDQSLRHQCEDDLNYTSIIQSRNASACNKLHEQTLAKKCQDTLYFLLATENANKSVCQQIELESLKDKCLDEVEMFLAQKSLGDCDNIENDSEKQACLDHENSNASIKENNLAGCLDISDTVLRETCQATVTNNQQVIASSQASEQNIPQTNQEKLVACDDLNPGSAQICKDKINFDLAFEEKDISTYCNKISSPEGRQECLSIQGDRIDKFHLNKAISSKETSTCELIKNIPLKELCLETL